MLAIWLTLHALRYWVYGEGYTLSGHIQSALLATLLAVPMVMTARRWLDGGTLAGLGLPLSLNAAAKPFAIGALSFLAPLVLGLAVVLGFGWTTITPVAALGEILAFVPLLVVLVFLYEALPEELAFRGYLYRALAERHSRILGVIGQALLFGLWGTILWAIRLDTLPFERLMLFTTIGFVLGLVRVVTGSVWASIGLHTAFQTVAQLLLNEERGYFAITGTEPLQLVALGMVPFALATMIAERASRREVAWRELEDGKSPTPQN
ncbi:MULTISPECIES: CPBP family intramembrane glutamic endopeptidase [unclassified Microbulbifer]|uniref:CPBP family intramembrane glutamic endopeptidase n=1 Tax=unclassified Microbulbifer TaxID=2619833 RepID=UPI0027E57D23|nr:MULTISPECIES: CPBP family intramembrane glutamic endopeptidase [unclassified Microbulbifer]